MNNIFYIALIIFFLSGFSYSQVKDTISVNKSAKQSQVDEKDNGQAVDNSDHQTTGFIDEDGDGIDDRKFSSGKKKKRRTDRFVDNDGDGINDNRARGMGWGGKGKQGGFGRHGK